MCVCVYVCLFACVCVCVCVCVTGCVFGVLFSHHVHTAADLRSTLPLKPRP